MADIPAEVQAECHRDRIRVRVEQLCQRPGVKRCAGDCELRDGIQPAKLRRLLLGKSSGVGRVRQHGVDEKSGEIGKSHRFLPCQHKSEYLADLRGIHPEHGGKGRSVQRLPGNSELYELIHLLQAGVVGRLCQRGGKKVRKRHCLRAAHQIKPRDILRGHPRHARHGFRVQRLPGNGKIHKLLRLGELRLLLGGGVGLQQREKVGKRHRHGGRLLLERGIGGKVEAVQLGNAFRVHSQRLRHLVGGQPLPGHGKLHQRVHRLRLRLGGIVKI